MKKLFESFKKSFPWILGSVIFTAILDLFGLGGSADIGLGFILGFLLFGGFVIYQMTKKEKV